MIEMLAKEFSAKLEEIEKELAQLKIALLQGQNISQRKVVKMKGLLKGMKIGDELLEEAEKSLFSGA